MKAFGLLGGTFDPIHHGHLRLAEEMAEALGLDEVRLLPTGTPPHRGAPAASATHRLAMVQRAITGNPRFRLDAHEIHKTVPCYMVDTLGELRAELGHDVPIVLFLGADAFAGLDRWHDWRRLFSLCHIAVAERPGYDQASRLPPELDAEHSQRRTARAQDLRTVPCGHIYCQAITQLDISATGIRARIANHRSVRYLVPDAVLDYLQHHRLYQ